MGRQTRDWMVVCDFDGTISQADATDELLSSFADAAWLDIEDDWKAGLIGSQECLSKQVGLLKASSSEIDALADNIEIDPDFRDFAHYCVETSIPIAIVSDGLDRLIHHTLRRWGLPQIPVYANSLISTGDDAHRLMSPHFDPACHAKSGTCKCAVIEDLRVESAASRILFVGDGRSDFCAARRASDCVAAKSKLLAHLRKTGGPCVAFDTFADVQYLLASLVEGRTVREHEERTFA